jgi:predicted metal-binding membrane protein
MPLALTAALKRDRLLVAGALALVVGLAWLITARLALDMRWMMLGPAGWTAGYFAAMFAMWLVMMIGMMLPSAAPAILLFAALQGRSRVSGAGLFTAGYLACWAGFSLLATLAQWGLAEAGWLASPMMIRATPMLAAALFVAAAIYQLTPAKRACLRSCRSPAAFLTARRRTGTLGPFIMGLEHGAYCVGCCWGLMALLFAVGAMNLLWVAAVAAFVLAEKLLPGGEHIGRAGAIAMIGAAVWLLWAGHLSMS